MAGMEKVGQKVTIQLGGKAPNGLGLHDMSGNVREWVLDMYEAGYYQKSSVNDPKGSSTGSNRVTRGGTWNADARLLRSSDRFWIWDPGVTPGQGLITGLLFWL